jgi:hypothetical protein
LEKVDGKCAVDWREKTGGDVEGMNCEIFKEGGKGRCLWLMCCGWEGKDRGRG